MTQVPNDLNTVECHRTTVANRGNHNIKKNSVSCEQLEKMPVFLGPNLALNPLSILLPVEVF